MKWLTGDRNNWSDILCRCHIGTLHKGVTMRQIWRIAQIKLFWVKFLDRETRSRIEFSKVVLFSCPQMLSFSTYSTKLPVIAYQSHFCWVSCSYRTVMRLQAINPSKSTLNKLSEAGGCLWFSQTQDGTKCELQAKLRRPTTKPH